MSSRPHTQEICEKRQSRRPTFVATATAPDSRCTFSGPQVPSSFFLVSLQNGGNGHVRPRHESNDDGVGDGGDIDHVDGFHFSLRRRGDASLRLLENFQRWRSALHFPELSGMIASCVVVIILCVINELVRWWRAVHFSGRAKQEERQGIAQFYSSNAGRC